MDAERWNAVLTRITREDATDIDDLLLDGEAAESGRAILPFASGLATAEAPLKSLTAIAVGVRIAAPVADPVDFALRLVAFALERQVEIVILSPLDRTGLERFGFRVERVAGATEEERVACEAQIRRFWSIEMVI